MAKRLLSVTQLSVLKHLIRIEMGLDLSMEKMTYFEKKVIAACDELGLKETDVCVRDLLSGPLSRREIEVLASHLTVGETHFFRDKKTISILQNRIIPSIIQSKINSGKRQLRIWSAGSSTGEEPYTLAILLQTLLPDLKKWEIGIFGTDINMQFLKKASEGVYSKWSFRETPSWVKESYFKNLPNEKFEIKADIRNLVSFSYLNLAEETYPSIVNHIYAMDLILCRNVLMYFDSETRGEVINRLYHTLVDGGYLVVSPAEASTKRFQPFKSVPIEGITFYRKEKKKLQGEKIDRKVTKPASTAPVQIPTPSVTEQHTQVPQKEPSALKGSYSLAEQMYRRGEFDNAIEELLRCDRSINVIYLLTKSYADRGDFASALDWCNKLINSDRLEARNYYLKANILEEMQMEEEAFEALRQAIFLDPQFILAHFNMANHLKKKSNETEAAIYYQNAKDLLRLLSTESIVPESDGLPAGRLLELIEMIEKED